MTPSAESPTRVLIAGAGVAGLEAALALHRLAPGLVDVELLDPSPDFVYRPLLVAEPFGVEATMRFPLDALAERAGARLRGDALSEVHPAERLVLTAGGAELGYDALLLAPGATPTESIPGAITFGTPDGRAGFENLLGRLGRRGWGRIAFVVPRAATWTIAAYELVLLTAAERAARALDDVELVLVTHERAPLETFGAGASEVVASRLAEEGVELRAGVAATAHEDGALLVADGPAERCDRAVALPALTVGTIAGLPQGPRGFLKTDVQMQVAGLSGVWAAGDATSFPVKQGGLAAQQADVAARAIAVRAGSRLSPAHYRPVLRAELITADGPEFLRAHRAAGEGESAHSREPLWWPPEKLAARYLGPLLAAESAGIEFGELIDLDPPDDQADADAETRHAVALLLAAADADARDGDPAKALASLALAERLELVLPPEYVARRDRWRRELDPAADPVAGGGSDRPHARRRRGRAQRPRAPDRAPARARGGHRRLDAPRPLAPGRGDGPTARALARDGTAAERGLDGAAGRRVRLEEAREQVEVLHQVPRAEELLLDAVPSRLTELPAQRRVVDQRRQRPRRTRAGPRGRRGGCRSPRW